MEGSGTSAFRAARPSIFSLTISLFSVCSGEVRAGDELVAVEGRERLDFKAAKELILGR